MNNNTFKIDNITWNDLSLEDIYSRLNSCVTSAGDDYLYERLRNPFINECEEFANQTKLFKELKSIYDEEITNQLAKIGKLKNYKFKEVIKEYENAACDSNKSHFIISALVILSFLLIFLFPGPGFVLFFGMIAYSVSDYFKKRDIIASKLTVFNYLIKMVKESEKLAKSIETNKSNIAQNDNEAEIAALNKNLNRILEIATVFKPFMRMTFLISEGAKTNSNPFSVVFDYIRMIFHVDIIKYNSMISFLKNHITEANELYSIIGQIDTGICLKNIYIGTKTDRNKSFNSIENSNNSDNYIERIYITKLCKPIFVTEKKYNVEGLYHPLIKEPVCNSINTSNNVLITGCNASGKSTFLKAVALNSLFAQSLGFCFADKYEAPFYRIYTSMALRDNIDSGESYFMTEIKSLKRIVDSVSNGRTSEGTNDSKNEDTNDGTNEGINDFSSEETNVLCVIDEVLRGTNTVERISASVEILKNLCSDKALCFCATHDIELTELLCDFYSNYHFSEEITENDVIFNYKIQPGQADSRNAIRLLSILGYDEHIVKNATNMADRFIKEGVWK